jgi:hypothetical protein
MNGAGGQMDRAPTATGRYRATVVARGTRRAVFGATVTIGDLSGITAEDGTVTIDAVPAGTQRLIVGASRRTSWSKTSCA